MNDPKIAEIARAMVKADPRLALVFNIKTLEEAARIFMKKMKVSADLKAKED